MLTHRVTRGWVLILGRSLELFFRELAVSGSVARDKHGVPDGKLVAYKKLHLIKIFNFISSIFASAVVSRCRACSLFRSATTSHP